MVHEFFIWNCMAGHVRVLSFLVLTTLVVYSDGIFDALATQPRCDWLPWILYEPITGLRLTLHSNFKWWRRETVGDKVAILQCNSIGLDIICGYTIKWLSEKQVCVTVSAHSLGDNWLGRIGESLEKPLR